MTMKSLTICCTVATVVTLALILGWGYAIYRRNAAFFEKPKIPEALEQERILVGADSLARSTLIATTELGEIRSMLYGELDPSPGPELGIVGQTGALFVDQGGNLKSSISFVQQVDERWGVKSPGGTARFGDIQILDVDGDNICEFLVRNDSRKAELIDHGGNTVWTYGKSVRNDSFLEDMAGGDTGGGKVEYCAAYVGGKGLVLLDGSLIEKWEQPDVQARHIEFVDADGSGQRKILYSDFSRIVLRNADGSIVSQGDTGRYIGNFSVLHWPTKRDRPYLVHLADGIITLFDFFGKQVAVYGAPASEDLRIVHGVTVKLRANEIEYFAALVENTLLERSVLYVYDPARILVYQEVLPEAFTSITTMPLGNTGLEAVLIGGKGKVLEYRDRATSVAK